MIKLLKSVKDNSIIKYISSRYIIYIIQFINTLLIAKKLDPHNFGVWGFLLLIIIYFSYFNFGIPSSLNILASINKNKTKYVSLNFNTSLILIGVLSCIVIFAFSVNSLLNFNFGEKYNFNENSLFILFIIIIGYFNSIFLNIFRIYNKLTEITFNQSITPISVLIIVLFYNGSSLIYYLLIGMIISNSLSLILFIKNCPLKIKWVYSKKLITKLQKSGIYFFIYNTSFYLILISTRSIISYYYKVEEFGFFNFAYSISNVIYLLLNSFIFLVFPKIINKLSTLDDNESYKLIYFIRSKYVLITNVISHFAIMCFPIFILTFPKYESAIYTFNLITLTQLVYANCFGSPVLLMARKKEKKIALSAFMILIINIVMTFIVVKIFKVNYSQVIIASTMTYLIYIININRLSLIEINKYKGIINLLTSTFSINLIIPFIISFTFSILEIHTAFFSIPFIIYLLLNYKLIIETINSIKKILKKPELINI